MYYDIDVFKESMFVVPIFMHKMLIILWFLRHDNYYLSRRVKKLNCCDSDLSVRYPPILSGVCTVYVTQDRDFCKKY